METDFKYSVMTELAKYFKIHWFVLEAEIIISLNQN